MNFVEHLEVAWSDGGFLEQLRGGRFDSAEAAKFLAMIQAIVIRDDEHLPKRALSLLWYLPIFLVWQRERVRGCGGDVAAYDNFVTGVLNALERALGTP